MRSTPSWRRSPRACRRPSSRDSHRISTATATSRTTRGTTAASGLLITLRYVVTRNSHAAEIAQFLAARGVRVAGVRVVPKKESKASAMLALCPELALEGSALRAVFVDDDVFECIDPAVAALPGLMRVLFRRGAA